MATMRKPLVLFLFLALCGCAVPKTKTPPVPGSLQAKEAELQKEMVEQEKQNMIRRLMALECKMKEANPELEQFTVSVRAGSDTNAFADGKKVYILYGMMRFCQTDDELALVVGHEMAHNAMMHMEARKTNAMAGTVIDILVSVLTGVGTHGLFGKMTSTAHSGAFEQEADYVGLYYAARAGYDISNAANFWRRMAVHDPKAMEGGLTHPSSAERFVAMEAATAEIKTKQASGQPLIPEMQEAEAAVKRAEETTRDTFGAHR